MGCKGDLAGQLQEDGGHDVGVAAAEREEGSEEEEEPFERVFYDDDDDGNNGAEPETQPVDPCDDYPLPEEEEEATGEEHCDDAAPPDGHDASDEEPFYSDEEEDSGEEDLFHAEPLTDPVRNSRSTCRKQLHEVEQYNDHVANEHEFLSKRFSAVQAVRKEQNKQEALKQVLKKGGSNEQKVVPVTDEMEVKPFKKRLSVRFATDVSCSTYNTESFGAAKLEKRKAQFDDMDSQLCKRQEHMLSLPQDGGKLKEVDDTNLYVAKAITHLNGVLVEGRKMEVRVAVSSSTLSNSAVGSQTNTRTIKEIDMPNLYVCNIHASIDTNKLVELFLPFGKITHARVAADQGTSSGKGYGFVRFADPQCAAQAIAEMNGALIEGEALTVRVAGLSSQLSCSTRLSSRNQQI
ncbi:hypothetical protein ACQ4PT_027567 [Festuca glaucescens]